MKNKSISCSLIAALGASTGCSGAASSLDDVARRSLELGGLTDVYVVNSGAGNVAVVDGSSNEVVALIPVPGHPGGAAFSPDGRRLYVATGDDPGPEDIVVIDTDPTGPTYRTIVSAIDLNATIGGFAFSSANAVYADPGGGLVYFRDQGGGLGVVKRDVCTGAEAPVARVSGIHVNLMFPCAFAPLRVARELWCLEDGGFGHPSGVAIVDTDPASASFNTATELALPDGFNPQGVSISPDGTTVYLSSWGDSSVGLRVLDRATRTTIADIPGGRGFALRGNAVSADGTRVYGVTDGTTVLRKYDASGRTLLGDVSFDNTSDGVHFVALSLDASRAYVTSSNVNVLRVADVTSDPPKLLADVSIGSPTLFAAVQPSLGAAGEQGTDVVRPTFTFVPPDVVVSGCKKPDIGRARAIDDCGSVSVTNDAPRVFPCGKTTVTWKASDAAGNVVSATQQVTRVCKHRGPRHR